MIIKKNRFSKGNRLVNRKDINSLFNEGHFFIQFPFKVFYIQKVTSQDSIRKVLFSVPKRKVYTAVKRNKVKRLLRESYRLHHFMLDSVNQDLGNCCILLIGYVYIGGEHEINYMLFKKAMIGSFQYLSKVLVSKK